MSTKMHIEFISQGFHDILCSDGVKSLVDEKAQEIKAKADAAAGESEGFQVTTMMGGYGGGRWISHIQTTDRASMIAEAEHNALTGAIG